MHKKMKDLGYSLPVPIQKTDHILDSPDVHQLTSYHIRPEDWVKHWMNHEPELLGGFNADPFTNFEAYWRAYQVQHPSHEVFSKHHMHLDKVVPLFVHGDEGKAVKRTNYLVLSVESPLGSLDDPHIKCTCCEDLRHRAGLPSYGSDLHPVGEEFLETCRQQTTNFKGHSFLSRCLCFGVGGWIYKRHPHVVDRLLAELVKSLQKLFFDGVPTKNGLIFAAVVGIKGDLDFHKKVMGLTRSYANIGTKNYLEICHLCLAGRRGISAEDYSETPQWLQTVCCERPWSTQNPPTMSNIPYDPSCPEEILKLDMFHVNRLGVGRDVIGGVLILLLRLNFFDYPGSTINLPDRFSRAHGHFALWCLANRKKPGLHSFSKSFFNMVTLVSAPWASSKGSDTVLLLEWLQTVLKLELRVPTVQGHEELLGFMLQVVESCLDLRVFHHHGLWLERQCAKRVYVSIMTLLRGYSVLARYALQLKIRAFIQKPKQHSLHDIGNFLKSELLKGATLIQSPQSTSCDMNEDFVGRISRLSRRVGFQLCDLRVIERYFMKIKVLLSKRKCPTTLKVRKVWAKRWGSSRKG